MIPIKNYLQTGEIPKNESNSRTFKTKISKFTLIQDKLYKKSLAGPYLKCLDKSESLEVLRDIHEGDCDIPSHFTRHTLTLSLSNVKLTECNSYTYISIYVCI